MKVLVSACLMGENCKYNGSHNKNEKVIEWVKNCDVIPVCPEVLGGLPTPRVPSEIVNGKVYSKDGKCVDDKFHKGAQRALEIALKEKVDCAILQSRSPSCGVNEIYDGSFSNQLISGNGIFVQYVRNAGISVLDASSLEKDLIYNLHRIHTTDLGRMRLSKNLDVDTKNVLDYCLKLVLNDNSIQYKRGKNWYIEWKDVQMVIHSTSYTIITAHRGKDKWKRN